jgi:hypothetical protein
MATIVRRPRITDDIPEVLLYELLVPVATRVRPGSPEKIEVMRRRWEGGEALHHPDDERMALHRVPYTRPLHVSASVAESSYREEALQWTFAG